MSSFLRFLLQELDLVLDAAVVVAWVVPLALLAGKLLEVLK